MAKLGRWAGYGLISVSGLLLIAAAVVWLISSAKLNAAVQPREEHLRPPTGEQISDARRRARTLGCFGCHGEGLRGNKMFDEPAVGTIWAPNLTRVAVAATDQQLARAIRQGIGVDGRTLVIMPSEQYQHLSDQEVAALIAMVRTLPRSAATTPGNRYGPLGRLGIAMGKISTAPRLVSEYASTEPVPVGAQFEHGRQLAMTTCSGCHGADLTGKEAKPGERSPDLTIVGAYDPAAFTKLLRTGVPAGGQKLALMGTTAQSELSHLTDQEVRNIYSYLSERAQRLSK